MPVELDRALVHLDDEMDNLFNYHDDKPAAVAKPKEGPGEPKGEGVDELKAMLAKKVRRPHSHSRAEQ